MIGRFLGDAFGVLSYPFWSTVLQCGARLQIPTLTYWTVLTTVAVRFLTGSAFHCNIAHRRSVAVLCILYIRSCVTRCTIFMVLYLCRIACASAGYSRCFGRTSVYSCASLLKNFAYHMTFISLSVSLWNDLADPVFFDGVLYWRVFRALLMHCVGQSRYFYFSTVCRFSSFFLWVGIVGLGSLN